MSIRSYHYHSNPHVNPLLPLPFQPPCQSQAELHLRYENLTRKSGASAAESHQLYYGAIYSGQPIRDPRHKNFVSLACYKWSVYPPYAHGPYLIISGYLVRRLVASHDKLAPKIIRGCGALEDLQVSSLLV
jgi:hypothetical protein